MWPFDLFKKKPSIKIVTSNPCLVEKTIEQPKSIVVQEQKSIMEQKPMTDQKPKSMVVSLRGIECIVHDEGFRPRPYLDIKQVPTIGFGTTIYPNGTRVTLKDDPINRATAMEYLMHHVRNEIQAYINPLIKVELTQNQYDAITSLVYNIGIGQFRTSTVLRKINERDFNAAADAFLMWIKPIELMGRRKRERELFKSVV